MGRQEDGKNLGGFGGGETIIKIYLFEYMKNVSSIKYRKRGEIFQYTQKWNSSFICGLDYIFQFLNWFYTGVCVIKHKNQILFPSFVFTVSTEFTFLSKN